MTAEGASHDCMLMSGDGRLVAHDCRSLPRGTLFGRAGTTLCCKTHMPRSTAQHVGCDNTLQMVFQICALRASQSGVKAAPMHTCYELSGAESF